jgi:hypothetical protein
MLENRIPKSEIGSYIDCVMRKALLVVSGTLLVWAALPAPGPTQTPSRTVPVIEAAPVNISPDRFAAYVRDLSEPEGYFDTDNFISNETSYLHVMNDVRQVPAGGVYLGVGPDQNFSYIVHSKPGIAIIVDIRRQNMLQHLLYKSLFELSETRAQFLGRMFSRTMPSMPAGASLPQLLAAVRRAPSPESQYRSNLSEIVAHLKRIPGLALTDDDYDGIAYVYHTFYVEGLDLRFSSIGRNNAANYPTFESLLLQTDRSGQMANYLSTEQLYSWMRNFQMRNLLIPVVGNFAGRQAFAAVADFLKRSNLQVSAFYTSNVEYYLFGTDEWQRYVTNVRSLPIHPEAVFIRSYFGNSGAHPLNMAGHRSTTLTQKMATFVSAAARGELRAYRDLLF